MTQPSTAAASQHGMRMALLAAFLGWMFDGFEIGMFPLVGPSALNDLLGPQLATNPTLRDQWFGVIMSVFLVGAATGGVVFGWLGDRIGRVRAMSLSIFVYAFFTGLCGFASEAWHLAALRFIASLGMGGEWALGVALVTELWPEKSRALVAGVIGAAANIGMLLVGLLSLVLVSFIHFLGALLLKLGTPPALADYLIAGEGWRLMMIAGALPALLIFYIRLFVPESHKWEAERAKGATSNWASRDLLGVVVGAAGALLVIAVWSPFFNDEFVRSSSGAAQVSTLAITVIRVAVTLIGLLIALFGYIYPVKRYLGRAEAQKQLAPGERRRNIRMMLLGACLAAVPLLGTWGSLQWAPKWAASLAQQLPAEEGPYFAKEYAQIASSSGAVIAAFLAALVAGRFGRRITYAALCVASFIALVVLYRTNDAYDAKLLWSIFAAGGITAAFYGWFPLYLPELFPTSIRATAQGFAYNFGRVLSAVGSLQTVTLTAYFAQGIAPERVGIDAFPKAGATLAAIYLLGLFLIFWGPETKDQGLPD